MADRVWLQNRIPVSKFRTLMNRNIAGLYASDTNTDACDHQVADLHEDSGQTVGREYPVIRLHINPKCQEPSLSLSNS